MRYVGLVFLGMILWAGQAGADQVSNKQAERIITRGETIGEDYYGEGPQAKRISRVVYNLELYICMDFLGVPPNQMPNTVAPTNHVLISCWDDN